MKTKITVNYYLRKSKVNAQAQMPIYQRITINAQRFDVSTGLFVEGHKWSSEASKIKGNSEEARLINGRLDMMRAIVYETEKKLFMNQIEITFESFKNELTGKKERERMLIPIFQEHNRKIKELVGQKYAPGTSERYETSLKHAKDFIFSKYNITDINIEKIDHSFITEYEFYLRSERKCANNTAVKYIKNFHKIINQCLANGWLNKDTFSNYNSKIKEVVREFLSEAEIEQMMNKDFVSEQIGTLSRYIGFKLLYWIGLQHLQLLPKKLDLTP